MRNEAKYRQTSHVSQINSFYKNRRVIHKIFQERTMSISENDTQAPYSVLQCICATNWSSLAHQPTVRRTFRNTELFKMCGGVRRLHHITVPIQLNESCDGQLWRRCTDLWQSIEQSEVRGWHNPSLYQQRWANSCMLGKFKSESERGGLLLNFRKTKTARRTKAWVLEKVDWGDAPT